MNTYEIKMHINPTKLNGEKVVRVAAVDQAGHLQGNLLFFRLDEIDEFVAQLQAARDALLAPPCRFLGCERDSAFYAKGNSAKYGHLCAEHHALEPETDYVKISTEKEK